MSRTARRVLCALALAAALLALLLFARWPAVVQRGNPLPYLAAALRLSDMRPFAPVPDEPGVYLVRRAERDVFLAAVSDRAGLRFLEQVGSGYRFTDGKTAYTLSSEVYWGRYLVFTLPQALAARSTEPIPQEDLP